jgi:hypothetical protein
MHNENFSDFETRDIHRFEGKHHLIASFALSSLFEDEDDIKNAFNETITE